MDNPFIFGKAVVGRYFVNRKQEINELKSALLAGQNVVLFSPRKMGKTSLILELFRKTQEAKCVYIDLWQITSEYSLAKAIIDSVISETYTSFERLGRDIKDLLKSIRSKAYIDSEGHLGVEFSREAFKDALHEALELPERIASKKGIKLIVAFDEFQEIEHFNGLKMEKLIRSILQHHQNVSYIFAGSEQSIVEVIFGQKDRPFYRFAKHMVLKPIESNELRKFIKKKFRQSGKNIDKNAVNWIVEFSEGIPHYMQHLCHESWYLTEDTANLETVKSALEDKIIPTLSSGFQTIWDKIKSDEQRTLLIALAQETNPAIYSYEFIDEYNLKMPGHVKRAAGSLEKKGLIEKNKIWDLFFREWLKTSFAL